MNKEEIKSIAAKWVQTHQPFFAIDVRYGVSAFVAGYEAAMNEKRENDDSRERSENV